MILFQLLISLIAVAIPVDDSVDTIVFCPTEYQAALKPWVEYRSKQGHRIKVVSPEKTSVGIKSVIQKNAKSGKLKYVVLIGDSRADRFRKNQANLVPTDYVRAKINVKYGAVPDIATDNKYADLDADGAPDLSIGRIPVDSVEELKLMIKKIIQYEKQLPNTLWRRKINFIAGVGGFGVIEDKIIENATKKLITEMVPQEYETSMTYASWNSPYCPDPRKFSETTINRMNEGCLFWVYVGHGHYRELDRVQLPQARYKIFDVSQVSQVKSKVGLPIAIFLACNTCGFDQRGDCIGEELLKRPAGPIAILGGSRVTMPYGMAVMSLEMMEGYFSGKFKTLGELIRSTKFKMVKNTGRKGQIRTMLDGLGKAFSPTGDQLDEERREHAHLIHLLGDPLLRLARPMSVKIHAPKSITSGRKVKLAVDVPFDSQATVELVYRRNRLTFRPPRRKIPYFSDSELAEFQPIYEKANARVKARQQMKLSKGQREIELEIPSDARGECEFRVFLQGKKSFAAGASNVKVRLDKTASRPRKIR